MFRRLALPAALAGCLALTGCGTQVDLTKSVSPRKTIAEQSSVEAFTADKLRQTQPCELLDPATLAEFGKPGISELRNYSECGNVMQDKGGKRLSFVLKVGENLSTLPKTITRRIGGLPAIDSKAGSSCFQSVVTDKESQRGITLQAAYDGGDGCPAAIKVLEVAVRKLRDNPPKYPSTQGSLYALDPCQAADDSVTTGVLGQAPQKRPYGLHACYFDTRGVSVMITYGIRVDPKLGVGDSKPVPTDLGTGVTGYAVKSTSQISGKCNVEWTHRQLQQDGKGENVVVQFDRTQAQAGEDPCAKAATVAKAIVPKLPKP